MSLPPRLSRRPLNDHDYPRPTTARISSSTKAVGFWSAVLASAFSIAYILGQLAEWLGWLGSKGDPESASTPLGIAVLLTPSLIEFHYSLTEALEHHTPPDTFCASRADTIPYNPRET